MKKKWIAALLAAAMCGMSAAPAGAALVDVDAASTDTAEVAELDLSGTRATVTDKQEGRITVKSDRAGTVTVLLGEDTIIMDTQTGLPAGEDSIKTGDEVCLYCGDIVGLSNPPQVNARAVLVNLTDEHAPANLLTAETVTRNADGTLTVQAQSGSLMLNIAKNAQVTPFSTKNIVTLDDIRMGTRFFAWYDIVLESYPMQAGTDKVVLLPQTEDPFTIVMFGDIAIGEGRMVNGVAMLPLRKAAEQLGYTVTWNNKDRSAHLTNGKVQTTVTIGEDEYFRATAMPDADGMSKPSPLGAAPYLDAGRTWVPAELFRLLGELTELRGETLYLGAPPTMSGGAMD